MTYEIGKWLGCLLVSIALALLAYSVGVMQGKDSVTSVYEAKLSKVQTDRDNLQAQLILLESQQDQLAKKVQAAIASQVQVREKEVVVQTKIKTVQQIVTEFKQVSPDTCINAQALQKAYQLGVRK